MKVFAIGDIHGAHKSLMQCLDRSAFDYEKDRLIVLGDVCDGYPEVRLCIDELLKIRHCDIIIGNHDQWALDWALRGDKPKIWTSQGGDRTMASYAGGPMPQAHIDILKNAHLWLELDGQIFVHGGFYPGVPLTKQTAQTLMWDRDLLDVAWKNGLAGIEEKFGGFKDIFVGHTTTQMYRTLEPIHACNVWDLDTGAGWSGKLTMMNVKTKKYWQSDFSADLYGGTPDYLR
ncbi:MAG: metallophosphoesterase [Candidatus Omnitrophica bacterium]|nr:metallophosphoesterase [Candidatus Omnitrophota bacterium]